MSPSDIDRTYGVRTRVCAQALTIGLTSLATATADSDEQGIQDAAVEDLCRIHGLDPEQARHCMLAGTLYASCLRAMRMILAED